MFAVAVDELRDPAGAPLDEAQLGRLAVLLEAACEPASRARFAVRDGVIVGLLAADADPLRPILVAGLLPEAPRGRWAVAACPGWEEDALVGHALEALAIARASRDGLVVRTPEPGADRLLDAIAPLLAELLGELTERQRELARLLVLDGRRQADAADVLGVSRATVSVMAARGRVRAIQRLAGAVRALVAAALDASAGGAGPDPADGSARRAS